MPTTVTIAGTEVAYRDFSITVPTSPMDIAPSAEVTTNATESVAANDPLEIAIDGTTVFAGYTRSGGTISELGGVEVDAAHGARDVFEDTVSLSLVSPTDAEVLTAALSAAGGTTSLTLDYSGTATALNNDYDVTDRPVKRVFRDMMDRTGRVWWVDPAGTTVHVQPLGGRGTWKTIDTQGDRATLQRFDTGNVDTVRNAVTVVGTGEEQVRATVEDTTSISTYGRRPGNSPYNVAYITTQSEAAAVADELIIADPQPEGTLLAGTNVGDITQPLANYEVDVRDAGKNLDIDNLVIESQTIEQGQATLSLGAGVGVSIEEINRSTKSQEDQNEPGSVYNSDRIADDSVDSEQLVDSSVIEQKLDDLAVTLNKVDFDAIDETKIQDGSVRTPQLFAQAVTAEKINTELARAERLLAGTIEAQDIATDTLTANQIDTLDLDTSELSVTTLDGQGIEFTTETISGSVSPQIVPVNSGQADVGSTTSEFRRIIGNTLVGSILDISGGNESTFSPAGSANPLVIDTNNGDTALHPRFDNGGYIGGPSGAWAETHTYSLNSDLVTPINGNDTGNVGVSGNYWNGMRSNAYFEESPEPVVDDDVDLDELTASEWYDLPEYVRRETARKQVEAEGTAGDAEADGGLPDPDGVELGTMLNYVFEVAKAQQERIDDLEDRLAAVEGQQ